MRQIVKYQSPDPSPVALIDISPTVPIAPIVYSTLEVLPPATVPTSDATPGTKTVIGQDSIAFTLGKICGGLMIAIGLVFLGIIIAKLSSPTTPVAPSVIVVQPEPLPTPATTPQRSSCLVLCSGN